MGWLYCEPTKAALVDHLLHQEHIDTLDFSLRGNNLWAVMRLKTGGDPFIMLFLLSAAGWKDSHPDCRWGYKDVGEEMGPVETDCPLKFLGMVPDPGGFATEWRQRVIEHHANVSLARKLAKSIQVGDTVTLSGSTRLFRVTSLNPLLGFSGHNLYRLPKSRIQSVTKEGVTP